MADEEASGFPLGVFLGLTLDVAKGGVAVARLTVDERHLNPNGAVHGAVLFAMVDTAMGAAVVNRLPEGRRCASTDVHIRFLRAVSGGAVEASARIIHEGRRSVRLDGDITCAGKLEANATGTFAVLGVRSPGST